MVFNEFEQLFSTSTAVDCFNEVPLSDLDTAPGPVGDSQSFFNMAVEGTLTGQTRIRPASSSDPTTGNGRLAIAEEFHSACGGTSISCRSAGDCAGVGNGICGIHSAAYNVDYVGTNGAKGVLRFSTRRDVCAFSPYSFVELMEGGRSLWKASGPLLLLWRSGRGCVGSVGTLGCSCGAVLVREHAPGFVELLRKAGREQGDWMERKTILVVEDNLDNRRILVYRLQKIGDFRIVEASNGQEALEAVGREQPDLDFHGSEDAGDGWMGGDAADSEP